jgi:hypothetical protein
MIAGNGASLSLPWRHLPTRRLASIGFAPSSVETFWGPETATKVNPALDLTAGAVLQTAAQHRLPAFLFLEPGCDRFGTRWHGFTHHLS